MATEFPNKFQAVVVMIEKIGLLYAEAKGQSWQLQEMKSVVLNRLMSQQPAETSMAQREMLAKIHPDYVAHLEGTKAAIVKEHQLKAKLSRYESQLEAYRSLCSLQKTEMQLAQ